MSEESKAVNNHGNVMDPHREYVEINSYVIFWGLFFASLFSLAIGYLGLKIGQTVDAFAPVSVLAMGMAILFKRANAFPETVHIQAIAASSTNVLPGVIFFLPALYILNMPEMSFLQMLIPIVVGGILGVSLSVMFRRYFVDEMDAVYPFPAGRAGAEVLSSSSGSKAKLMVISGTIGAAFDFVLNTLGWWSEHLNSNAFALGRMVEEKFKLTFRLDSDVALLGIGYFTGLRYAAIICGGSFFAWYVCMPTIYYLAGSHMMVVDGQTIALADAPLSAVFSQYVRHIGIGMLAMAGIIGMLTMSGVVKKIMTNAIRDIFSKDKKTATVTLLRTQRDIPVSVLAITIIVAIILFTIYFHVFYSATWVHTLLAFVLVLVFSFLLSIVGISSLAYTGNEPVSGMTIFMLIVSSVVLSSAGMGGDLGIMAVLLMAAFIGTTVSCAGNFMSEQKVCYLLGATPKKMQQWQLLGVIVSAIVSIGVMILLNKAYGFTGPTALQAPQANAMAAIAQPLMAGGSALWPLYMAGAFFAVVLWMIGVPPLAFALGTYLPIDINMPVLVGGFLSWLVSSRSKDEKLNQLRLSEGSTVASGFVAGGAIGSLASAVLHIGGVDWFADAWNKTQGSLLLGVVMYLVMCAVIYVAAMKIKSAK